jgi:hypothetical protein
LPESLIQGQIFAYLANCSGNDLNCLRALSPEFILGIQAITAEVVRSEVTFIRGWNWGPWIDGVLLSDQVCLTVIIIR